MVDLFYDPSDDIANKKGIFIEFFHVPTGKTAAFKAFLTAFEDSFETTWASEEVYGRMDPIQTYQGTKRSLNLGWTLPAATVSEAKRNMAEVSRFIRMQYPVYKDVGSTNFPAHAIASPPLFKLKFANLVASAEGYSGRVDDVASPSTFDFGTGDSLTSQPGSGAQNAGLLGTLSGFNFTPVIDDGFFDPGFGTIFPKTLECSCQMIVLHEHPLGFDAEGNFRTANFPYGFYDANDGASPLQTVGTFGETSGNAETDLINEQRAKDMDRAKTDEERQAVQDHYEQEQEQIEEAIAKGILNPDGTFK